MNTSYVCLRCSRKLLRLNGQLRSSSFVSLGQLVGNDDYNGAAQEKATLVNGETVKRKFPRHGKRKSFAQQYRESKQHASVDKVLEELFSSSQAPRQSPERSRYSRTPKDQVIEPATHGKSIDHRLLELAKHLRCGTSSLEDTWTSCRDLLGQKIWASSPSRGTADARNPGEDNAFRDILLAICSKRWLVIKDEIVTPASVIQVYGQHGVMRYWWHTVLWSQLAQVIQLRYAEEDSISKEELRQQIDTLMKGILKVWNLFMQRWDAVPGEFSLQAQNAPRDRTTHQSGMYRIFLRLFPKHPSRPQTADMAAAAVMTLDCMEAAKIDDLSYLSHCFRQIKKSGKLDRDIATRCLSYAKVPTDITEKALVEWGPHEKVATLGELSARRHYQGVPLPKPTDDFGWSKNYFATRMAEIDGTAKRSDPEAAMELWANFERHLKASEDTDQEKIDKFFARFLRTFWAVRRSDYAITVWNYMVNSGNLPNQVHWTAMLAGCVRARDVKSMQEIWSNMLRSGMKPDIPSWTTYIHGLIVCHKWQEGLSALEALGKTWNKSSTTETGNAGDRQPDAEAETQGSSLTPTMAPVHGALSALTDIQRPELNPTIIAWAESQGLRLTTYTFNILLKPLVRTGEQSHIASHLAQMQLHNCPPDIATFTIILNGLVSNPTSTFHSLPPREQETTIITMLAEMESHSIAPNPHTYSTLLDGLLGKTDPKKAAETTPNVPAARTVLAHMSKRNITPSPHIYTILITHYFSLSPPDLPAIDSLWASIRHSGLSQNLDPVFYDRLIEGYADIDEYEKALSFLRRVPLEGKTPGWTALGKLLHALTRAGEWDVCAQLVGDAEDTQGLMRHGEGTWRGRREFWEEVDRLRARGVIDGGQD